MASLWRRAGQYLSPAYIKGQLIQALSLGDPPEKIALGMTVGVVVGIFPTFYVGLILTALGARLFKYNMVAAVAGTAVATPLTSPFIIAASAALGSVITGLDWTVVAEQIKGEQFWTAAWAAILTYLAGNLILCALSSVPTYLITKRAVVEFRRRRGALA